MTEIELWDGTKANPKPIAKLGVDEDGELKVLAGEGKVRVREIPLSNPGSEFEKEPEKLYTVHITNLSMQVDLNTGGVIGEDD